MDGIKFVLEIFGKIISLWWLWLVTIILAIWKLIDLTREVTK